MTKLLLRSTLVLVLFCFSHFSAFSAEWINIESNDGVTISYAVESCSGQPTVFIRIENESESNVSLSFDVNLNDGANDLSMPGLFISLTPGEVKSADCDGSNPEMATLPVQGNLQSIQIANLLIDMQ